MPILHSCINEQRPVLKIMLSFSFFVVANEIPQWLFFAWFTTFFTYCTCIQNGLDHDHILGIYWYNPHRWRVIFYGTQYQQRLFRL